MKMTFKYLSTLLAALCVSSAIFADLAPTNSTSQDLYWINGGLGIGGSNNLGGGPAGEVSLNFSPSMHSLWTLRYAQVINFDDAACFPFLDSCGLPDSLSDVGLMYGLMAKNENGYISGSAGLSYVRIDRPEVDWLVPIKIELQPASYYQTVGVPLEVQAFWTPFKYVGIGVIGFADANVQHSFYGALAALQVGLLK